MNNNGSKSLKIIQNYQKWGEPSHRKDANGPKSNIKMSQNRSKSNKMNGIIKNRENPVAEMMQTDQNQTLK